ncbi:MAG: hypothetical protein CVU65_15240, partial [Deltaproteobacteria bacterium HGW-Deltaproteobacteria-22]
MHQKRLILLLFLFLLLLLLPACEKATSGDPASPPAPMAPAGMAVMAGTSTQPPAPPPVEPLRAWEMPAPPAFTPTARILLVHNTHTAWNQNSCAGPVLDGLRAFFAAERKPDDPGKPHAPFWVGPDSLAPRELAADLRGAPVSPLTWVRFLREQGVPWMVLGRLDRKLGRETIEQLARDTGMRFVTDIWEGPAFSSCVTESVASMKIAVCVLSSDSLDAAATWTRLRATEPVADFRVLFTSGDPSWQKSLATLPDPPDVFIVGGIVHYPHGRMLTPDRIALASGADLRSIGELSLSPGRTPGARPFLVSEHLNLAAERTRLQESFGNVARILAGPGLAARQRGVYERRLSMIRADWVRLATRAQSWSAQATAPVGPLVSFS